MQHFRPIELFIGVAALTLVAGCGGGGGTSNMPPLPSRFLYASAYSETSSGVFSGAIFGFGVDLATGALTPVPGSPFATTSVGAPVAITRDSKFLYSVDSATGKLLAFLIHSDGSVSAVPGAPFATAEAPGYLVADPMLDFLYGSGVSGKVMVFAIDSATGAASLTSTADATSSGAATITPDGRYYYQALPGGAYIAGFSTNAATGALSPVPGFPLFLGINQFPNGMAVDPAGKFLYVSNGFSQMGYGGPLYAYSIDAVSGALTAVPGSPFGVSAGPQISVAVDASGKFLIVSSLTGQHVPAGNSLVVLSIDPDTGALTPVPGSPFGLQIGVVVADPSAPYVYIGSGAVVAYSIDQTTGALTQTGKVTVSGTVSFMALTN